MTDYSSWSDAALLTALRAMWEDRDPPPADLADRMVAVVAIEDLARDWELLSLLADTHSPVRAGHQPRTLQFGDGSTHVLLHLSDTENGRFRIDGWVDAGVLAVRLVAGGKERSASPQGSGRFAFDDAPPGTARLRLVVRDDGGLRDFATPDFEL